MTGNSIHADDNYDNNVINVYVGKKCHCAVGK